MARSSLPEKILSGRFQIMKTDGSWETPYPYQVVQNDTSKEGLVEACKSSEEVYKYNRHTKAVFHQGQDGKLYVIWGYSFPLYDIKGSDGKTEREKQAPNACKDLRHYTEDDHEVFFAYSTDMGKTWKWKGAKQDEKVSAGTCTATGCSGGIPSADPKFRLTTVRQGEHRKIWVEADGRVNIAFVGSTWCDSSLKNGKWVGCIQDNPTATQPGALMYLSFYPGQTQAITPVIVNKSEHNKHKYLPGIRVEGGKVYIWAQKLNFNNTTKKYEGSGPVIEYVSSNGTSFTSTTLTGQTNCSRSHGDTSAPEFKTVLIASSCSGNSVQLYRKDF